MKNIRNISIIVAVLIILFLLLGPFFMVQEGELAVVVRFGKIEKVETTAGLKFKVPIVDSVNKYPKKIQSWDGDSELLPTEENQFIWVNTTARWKISDLKLFYESVGTINQAQSRLDDVIDSSVRKIIARNSLRESVRNSNIINEIARKDVFITQAGIDEQVDQNIQSITTYTNVTYEEIKKGRNKLSEEMLHEAIQVTPQYGIELIDIIIRQIKYSDDLTQSVFNRMIKERNQIAQAFRSEGEGQKAEWLGKMEKELLQIQSEAEKKVKEIKAKADGEALDIRNRAYSKDADFADFWMALIQYQNLLPKMKKILTTDFDFFKYLYNKLGR
jgi:membrane protease subunit HflC